MIELEVVDVISLVLSISCHSLLYITDVASIPSTTLKLIKQSEAFNFGWLLSKYSCAVGVSPTTPPFKSKVEALRTLQLPAQLSTSLPPPQRMQA